MFLLFLASPFSKGGLRGICSYFSRNSDFGDMMLPYNKKLKSFSRALRKNMTDTEKRLWTKIRKKQLKGAQFYRQKPIGNYIVDFYCPTAKLVIELDGGQHYTPSGRAKDHIRDSYLRSLGLQVLRFSDREIFDNLQGVLETIYKYL